MESIKTIITKTLQKLPYIKEVFEYSDKTESILDMVRITEYFELFDNVGRGVSYREFHTAVYDLDKNFKTEILKYMIQKGGVKECYRFSLDFGIDIKQYSAEDFIKGFDNSYHRIGNGLTIKDVKEFLFLYKNPEEFYKHVALKGYIELAYEIKLINPDLSKLSKTETEESLKQFSKRKNNKRSFMFQYNYEKILDEIYPDDGKYIDLMKDILKLTDEDKAYILGMFSPEILKNISFLKQILSLFHKKLNTYIEQFSKNLGLVVKGKIVSEIEKDMLKNSIEVRNKKIELLQKDYTNSFIITVFMDPFIGVKVLILQEKELLVSKDRNDERVEFFYDKSLYSQRIDEADNFFSSNLKYANIPYGVLFFHKKDGKTENPLDIDDFIDKVASNDSKFKKAA